MPVDLFGKPAQLRSLRHGTVKPPRGCAHCPLNQQRKVVGLDRISGRKAMLWAQTPGRQEEAKGLELVGDSGQLLWRACSKRQLRREMFDIQNVVRCRPDGDAPSKQELYQCSMYNQQALERNAGHAVVHLVLGQIAARQLFPRKPSRSVFWWEPWEAYIVLAQHPSYLLRLEAEEKSWPWFEFLDKLNAVRMAMKYPGRYGYVRSLDYRAINTPKEMEGLYRTLQRCAERGERVGVDIEDDVIQGVKRILMIGFAWGEFGRSQVVESWKGAARTVILDHPEADPNPARTRPLRQALARLMEDERLKKVFQHGSYDVPIIQNQLGVTVHGYDYDSQYATYLKHSNLRTYSLDSQCQMFFPEFADYKTMVEQYYPHLSNAPLDVLTTYNCADADLTKRIECKTRNHISLPLLQLYVNVAFVLDQMEQDGPLLDYKQCARLEKLIPELQRKVNHRLHLLTGNPEFNADSPPQVAKLLYDKLKLPQMNGRSTDKKVLEIMANEVNHPAPKLIMGARKLSKMKGTYIVGYRKSAEQNQGEVRTIWWLTGAATGRLRSGKGDKAEAEGIVNLQNIHGNPVLQNLLVSDHNWEIAIADAPDRRVLDLDVFMQLDYSQIEIRALAEYSGDKKLIAQFNSGQDIHCLVGHELTGWPVEKIASDKITRRNIKNFHFAIVFGVGRGGGSNYMKSKGVDMSEEQFGEYLHAYFERYAGVRRMIQRLRRQAVEEGHVDTLFGFRREVFQDESRSSWTGNIAINCVDLNTEILTKRGWLQWNELTKKDECLTETGWQNPTRINKYPKYKGPVHVWKHMAFSAVSTPNHRWKVFNSERKQDEIVTSATLSKFNEWSKHKIYRTLGEHNWIKEEKYTDNFVQVCGWVLTDGFVCANTGCGVSQSKQQNIPKIRSLLKELVCAHGGQYYLPSQKRVHRGGRKAETFESAITEREHVGCTYWYISGRLGKLIQQLFPKRVLTTEFINGLSCRQAKLLVKTMMLGDGSGDRMCCGTREKADAFQMLCTWADISTSCSMVKPDGRPSGTIKETGQIVTTKKPFYSIGVLRRKKVHVYNRHETIVKGKGVWCPTFTNDAAWVARREGCTYVTKNSPIQGTAHQLVLMAMALIRLQPKRFSLLQRPTMEVHDALYFKAPFRHLRTAHQQAKDLLEVAVPEYAASHFKRPLRVPLIAEASAGFCLGSQIEFTDAMSLKQILTAWRTKHKAVTSKMEILPPALAEVCIM